MGLGSTCHMLHYAWNSVSWTRTRRSVKKRDSVSLLPSQDTNNWLKTIRWSPTHSKCRQIGAKEKEIVEIFSFRFFFKTISLLAFWLYKVYAASELLLSVCAPVLALSQPVLFLNTFCCSWHAIIRTIYSITLLLHLQRSSRRIVNAIFHGCCYFFPLAFNIRWKWGHFFPRI